MNVDKCDIMNRFLQHRRYVLILLGILIPMIAKADSVRSATVETYYSENKEYKLIVTPRVIPDQYYQWSYYNSDLYYPHSRKIVREKEKFMRNISPQDTIIIPCTAELYRIKQSESQLIWKKILLNDHCPVRVIVANDGSSVATVDNWYSSGYGVNVFVVYNENGEAKRTYKLEEITPFPLNDYMMTVSSLLWNVGFRFIDNERIEIVFQTRNNFQTKRVYNVKSFVFEE